MVPSHKKQVTYSEDFVPVKDIRNGIIEMEDGRYIRVLEVEPINFLLRSTSEQKNIVASFASWMKISPIKIQIKVLTKKADIGKHLSTIERDMESESMIRLLTIFGVVEQRQMRLLFDHMSNRSYGQILARLRQEGLAYFSPDGQFLATSRYSLDHGKTQEAIMAFWAFIQMSDHVLDFCASEPPAILSFSSADKDYDLISGSQRNIPSINASRTLVPEASVRLIVVDDMKSLDELIPRDDNDYGVLTGSDGVEQIYKL